MFAALTALVSLSACSKSDVETLLAPGDEKLLTQRQAVFTGLPFTEDFELGNFSRWNDASSAPNITGALSAAAAKRGASGYRITDTSASSSGGNGARLSELLSGTGTLYVRYWLRVTPTSALGEHVYNQVKLNSDSSLLDLWHQPATDISRVGGENASGSYTNDTNVSVDFGNWSLIEETVEGIGTTSGRRRLWIDGQLQSTSAVINWGSGTQLDELCLGMAYFSDGRFTGTLDYDDYRADSAPMASRVNVASASPQNVGTCTAVTVTLRETSANALANAPYSLTVNLSRSGVATGSFYSDSSCTTTTTSVAFAAGANTATAYFEPASSGSATLTGAHADLLSGSQAITVNALLSNGQSCSSNGQCSSNFCTDGVCCNSSCNAGPCDACSIAAGGGANGTCTLFGSGTQCRASAGICDAAEFCTGSSGACPADAKVTAGTQCRGPAGVCDVAEACNGSSNNCPVETFVAGGTQCRASAGACDSAESCTGSSAACPADAKVPAGTQCRAAVDVCDVAETCNGSNDACPGDALATAGTQCRAAGGVCDVAESCTGSSATCPADAKVAAGTSCRASAGVCDVAENCNGSSNACPANAFVTAGTSCRASAGVCDSAEACTGSAAGCPADTKVPAGTQCRAAMDLCDVAEACDGSANVCPADAIAAAGTSCRVSAGVCDVAESCTGSSSACPADTKVAAGTPCRGAAGVCDNAEACDGVASSCPADAFVAAGSMCRGASGLCDVAETCSGSGPACPADSFAANGASCSDGVHCNGAETCQSGACQSGAAVVCTGPGVWTCVETQAACVFQGEPPVLQRNANLLAAVGLPYIYNAERRLKATGTAPITFEPCAGPPEFLVEADTGVVTLRPTAPGVLTLCVLARNSVGTDSYSFNVQVTDTPPGAAPSASALATPPTGAAPLPVVFDGTGSSSAVGIFSYAWELGDGAPSQYGATASHVFAAPGSYPAKLDVTDSYGRSATADAPVRVTTKDGLVPPAARIIASATQGESSLPVSFTCECEEGSAPIVAYRWELGPLVATGPAASHVFRPGRYRVHLTVYDENGLPGHATEEIVVTQAGNVPPLCQVFASPAQGPAPLTTTFSMVYSDPDSRVASRLLTFEDGTTSSALSVERTYSPPQRGRALLEVRDDEGLGCFDQVEVMALGPDGEVSPRFASHVAVAVVCVETGEHVATPQVVEGDGPFTWTVESMTSDPLPTGLTVDENTGVVRWLPTGRYQEVQTVALVVTSTHGRDSVGLTLDSSCLTPQNLRVGCSAGPGSVAIPLVLVWAGWVQRRRRARGSAQPAS